MLVVAQLSGCFKIEATPGKLAVLCELLWKGEGRTAALGHRPATRVWGISFARSWRHNQALFSWAASFW